MNPEAINFETIALIRRITDDGQLELEEIWDLAHYLNDNAKARKTWPGKRLWRVIQQVFEDNVVTAEEMHLLGKEIADIEDICAEIMAEEGEAEEEDRPPVDVTELSLPCVEKTVYTHPRNDEKRLFAANLRNHTCTCDDWPEIHEVIPERGAGRLCRHLVDAMREVYDEEKIDTSDWPEPVTNLIFILARLRLPAEPLLTWEFIEWDNHDAYVAYGNSNWATVFANLGDGRYEHFGFNLLDSRWSYGTQPPDAELIVRHLREHASIQPAGDTVDVTPHRADPEALTIQD